MFQTGQQLESDSPIANFTANIIVVLIVFAVITIPTAITYMLGVGQVDPNAKKYLTLFDVNLYKRGIMSPRDFVRNFGDLPYAAEVVYDGTLNQEFISDVRNGHYPVVEGVVAKGNNFSVKIKTNDYLTKLKAIYKEGWQNYWE